MAKMAFQHQAGTAMECLSVSIIVQNTMKFQFVGLHPKKNIESYF